jgi:hypothetical protein
MGRAFGENKVEEECIWDISGKARRKDTARKIKTRVAR